MGHPVLRDSVIYFDQYDLMDDCQIGQSLKSIEAHLGMDIRETTVSFNIDRPLTEEERVEVEYYCDHDVDATDKLDDLRQVYLSNKLALGREKNLYPAKALYMTNAKLTAAYLDAEAKPHFDEREYEYPSKLLRQYIPREVFDFFDRLKDMSIPNEVVFKESWKSRLGIALAPLLTAVFTELSPVTGKKPRKLVLSATKMLRAIIPPDDLERLLQPEYSFSRCVCRHY